MDTIHRAFTHTRFPDGDHRLVSTSPSEESGRVTVLPAHPLATEPGTLAGSPSMSGGPGQAHRAVRTDLRGRAFPRLITCPTRDSN